MIEWSEQHLMIQDMVRKFVQSEIIPNLEQLEHGDTPPYAVMRKLVHTFGLAEAARMRYEAEKRRALNGEAAKKERSAAAHADAVAMQLIPIIEISKYCPGMVTAMGVSMGLTAGAIMAKGTWAQKDRWALPLLTLEKVGAWAITEPGSGSDAFGAMKSTARRDGDNYVLNGQKTFITNGPYADTIVFICKLDQGEKDARDRQVVSFVLDKGMDGLVQSKPLRKMGMHSSPTGELFLDNVRCGRERLMGESEAAGGGREGAKATFGAERSGMVAMAYGIVERCIELCTAYARTRVQFGKPIGDFQLIQLKLAKMAVARMNIRNMLFRQIELAAHGKSLSFAEASANKLYAAQATMEVCLEAVQLFGGNGYMAEYQVEQLCRDAKVLQIYGGTDEIQTSQIARSMLAGEA
ncbi:MAG TPA: acyl-CoA dehydrogenase family protein [Candidatus Margulisiibacteriota bacterium]|nr:acyl-CoA dehydrogenase family protein [Candidatus Margulisiibacteriota bacterium]